VSTLVFFAGFLAGLAPLGALVLAKMQVQVAKDRKGIIRTPQAGNARL